MTAQDANGKRLESDPWDGVYEDDWRRIVACVNACQGIPTEHLESKRVTVHHVISQQYDERCFLIQGTESELLRLAAELLTEHDYTVTPPQKSVKAFTDF